MRRSGDTLTVAAAQLVARPLSDAPTTLEAIERLIHRAAHARAELVVLPECAYPTYRIGSVHAYRGSGCMSSSEYLKWLARLARQHRMAVVSGFIHDAGDALFNAAALIGPTGSLLGSYRKQLLWHHDIDSFSPGEAIASAESPLGRFGLIICADARVPEILATLITDGAGLIAMPTCWVNTATKQGEFCNPQHEFLVAARAREFRVPFICANKAGSEGEPPGYCGRSIIVRSDGSTAAEAPPEGEALILAHVKPARPRRLWMAESRRKRLLDPSPLVRPLVPAEPALIVAAMPVAVAEQRHTEGMGQTLFEPLRDRGVKLLAVNLPYESEAEHLTMLGNAYDIRVIAFPTRSDVFEAAGINVGCVSGQAIRSFAAARALALDGAQLLVVFDAPQDWPLLRSRALENRVALLAVSARFAAVIGPDGGVMDHVEPDASREIVASIDLAAVADKTIAPGTDIFEQRCPGNYRF